jgi:CDP-glucose 4,6-dehydratase
MNFYKHKRVFLTGHTGFKGSWMCKTLRLLGAEVTGYALEPNTEPNLFTLAHIAKDMNSIIGDIRDADKLETAVLNARPDIIIHMAAQPLVRESYKTPRDTYDTNVMGTVNILEAVRHCDSVQHFLNVTTDKVYLNNEWEWGYRETDILDGYDPYSNSKSCSELVTAAYARSFFKDSSVKIATARAGNVIGGGDYSEDRIIPDCVSAVETDKPIIVRNPTSVRPWQHVLEPVCTYLMLAANGAEGSYNVGPDDADCVTTRRLVELFCHCWGSAARWEAVPEAAAPHEAGLLRLDTSKIKLRFGWAPKWDVEEAMARTVAWYRDSTAMETQIEEYLK